MANKINEIVEIINNGESVEGLTARVDNLDDRVSDIENPTWILCDDVSSLFERFSVTIDRGCGRFLKDVKTVFNLKYQYTYNGDHILNAFYTATMYFKKGDIFRLDENLFPVINGKSRVGTISPNITNKVYFDFSFYNLLSQTTHYRPFTESINYTNNVTYSYFADLLCSRQNEELDYEENSFINIYVLGSE